MELPLSYFIGDKRDAMIEKYTFKSSCCIVSIKTAVLHSCFNEVCSITHSLRVIQLASGQFFVSL